MCCIQIHLEQIIRYTALPTVITETEKSIRPKIL